MKKKSCFDTDEQRVEIEQQLRSMVDDLGYITATSYSANGELYPDHIVSFVDKHMSYLTAHPMIDPRKYVANLRLMTKITTR